MSCPTYRGFLRTGRVEPTWCDRIKLSAVRSRSKVAGQDARTALKRSAPIVSQEGQAPASPQGCHTNSLLSQRPKSPHSGACMARAGSPHKDRHDGASAETDPLHARQTY